MEILKPYRDRIDDLDDKIIDLLAERTAIVHEVANLKFREHIPSVLRDRIDEVIGRVVSRADEKGADPEIIRQIYTAIIERNCALEDEIMAELSTTREVHPA